MIGLREEKGLSMYKIIMTHNRPWTKRELLLFIVLFVLVTSVLVRLFKKKRIVLSQVFAGELLFIYIMIVLASTVFTRTPKGMRSCKLVPFWSWLEAASGNRGYLKEIVLNIILFLPAGILLPFVFCKKILFRYAFMAGVFFSFVIECSQLILCRGLFEWDDMIDNTIGAVTGCMISNYIIKKLGKDEKSKLEDDDFDFASPM